jgi:protocatechuate 3,4-dioxygenase beta subunit
MSSLRHLPALAAGLALLAGACAPAPDPLPGDSAATVASPATTAALPTAIAATPIATPSAAPAATTAASTAPSTDRAAAALECTAPATPTLAQTEGPYHLEGAPEAADLVTDAMPGTRITLTGYVVDPSCAPVADAKVETWQADSAGIYDNAGYTLRGWIRTDAQGRFTLHTIVPGEYPGRTEHIHVKVTPPGGATLTSQLYFPGSTANGEDGIYDPSLDLELAEDGDALIGTYTFVVER